MVNGYDQDVFGEKTKFVKKKGVYRLKKTSEFNGVINKNSHLSEMGKEYPSGEDVKNKKDKEKLSFQEWAEKYRQ
ncbi:hypothetical protein Cst_c23730 [Thermoclostridium stercorarium subsp. stercorarium DSM 8532]|uniref:Uncharacterized protein n=2 Tax=Thermoclostridium stercorarium TaxID=1510 RepID=L7VUR5_THES1|nr:hypothetical protein [Thermoclostridium stercorarium]AGC69333.1 hypothetical protein Cst_c23730 [Thermoclostridium stercorarium subsp. stercorarium DSM 8532]AGI40298.1 hypothetical protein Clst_2275 [Thermoclostridium stercorarium subsp. stercorarium DSM 8532]ANW99595.1 hypothetical protein CSTERTH_11405 [Thermoclostridium stercorarium subsp. thermolacticum DSM 2910]